MPTMIRVSRGGSRVRVRLSNLYGTKPLQVTGATIARTRDGAAVEPGTVRSLTFHGARSATISAGRVAASDPAALPVSALESLTVTLFFADSTGPSTFHEDGLTASYRAAGDHRSDSGAAAFAKQTSHSFYYLTGVDVAGGRTRNTVVAFGDSITNGHNSTVGGNASALGYSVFKPGTSTADLSHEVEELALEAAPLYTAASLQYRRLKLLLTRLEKLSQIILRNQAKKAYRPQR